MQEFRLRSGETVVDRHDSHIHPGVEYFLPDILAGIDAGGRPSIIEETLFDNIIGETSCIATTENDEIVYAQRLLRDGYTRFVKGKGKQPSKMITVILKWIECRYVISTAYVGSCAPREPWDENASPDSLIFWNKHALVWGSEPVIPGTETTVPQW